MERLLLQPSGLRVGVFLALAALYLTQPGLGFLIGTVWWTVTITWVVQRVRYPEEGTAGALLTFVALFPLMFVLRIILVLLLAWVLL